MNKWIQAALPMVLGAGLAATGIGAPLAAAMVGGGAALRARKVDDASGGNALMTGLSAGMGAYGGANLMGGLQSLGSAQAPSALAGRSGVIQPASVAELGGANAAPGMSMGQAGMSSVPRSTAVADLGAMSNQATPWANIERGFGQTLTSPQQSIAQMGGWKSVGMNAAMAGAPIAEAAMRPEMPRPIEAPKGTMYNYEYDPGTQEFLPTDSSAEQRYFRPQYNLMSTRTAADGGLMALMGGGPVAQMSERAQPYIDRAAEGAPSYAGGGLSDLGHYSDGGRMLRGPGDGVSDSIPASIEGKRPARLADGEFVVPARAVSELGNGSSEAGARQLYAMLDRIQSARGKTTKNIAKKNNPKRLMPA